MLILNIRKEYKNNNICIKYFRYLLFVGSINRLVCELAFSKFNKFILFASSINRLVSDLILVNELITKYEWMWDEGSLHTIDSWIKILKNLHIKCVFCFVTSQLLVSWGYDKIHIYGRLRK